MKSYFQAGIKSSLDTAILKHVHPDVAEYENTDEIPYDFKRLSVVLRRGGEHLLVTKGEAESVFAICGTVDIDGKPRPFDESRRGQAAKTFQNLSAYGCRVHGVAVLEVEKLDLYRQPAERDMTLAGLAAFLDTPKEGITAVLEALKQNAVSVVIVTGDNQSVTQKVAHDVGLLTDRIVTGNQLDAMDDATLAYQAEHGAIFARVSAKGCATRKCKLCRAECTFRGAKARPVTGMVPNLLPRPEDGDQRASGQLCREIRQEGRRIC